MRWHVIALGIAFAVLWASAQELSSPALRIAVSGAAGACLGLFLWLVTRRP